MLKSTMVRMGAGARIAHHGPRIDRSMLQLETEYTCAVVPKKPKNGQLANEEGSIYGFAGDLLGGFRRPQASHVALRPVSAPLFL